MKIAIFPYTEITKMACGISMARDLSSGISATSDMGYFHYFTLRPFAALARPLPRVPRSPPRAAPPLPEGAAPPRLPPILDAGAGVENFEVALEDVGGFSTNEVSVVLQGMS